ncbi:TPA: protein kinase [Legionella feeleii]
MSRGRVKKTLNERTRLIQKELQARHKRLAGDIQAAKEGRLNIDGLNKLKIELEEPVKLSDTLCITIEECHPSTGTYKRALPKGYQSDITAINKAISTHSTTNKKETDKAPDAIKPSQTQSNSDVMAQPSDERQEAQLKSLSFANITRLIEQEILAYESHPSEVLISNPHHELINRACKIIKTTHLEHYSEYLDFLFSLTSKYPNSSIIDEIITQDIEETLIDVRKQGSNQNVSQTQRKLTAAEQGMMDVCDRLEAALKNAGVSEQEISNLMMEEQGAEKEQPVYISSIQKGDSPDTEMEFQVHVVRALIDLKPLKEPPLFEDDEFIWEQLSQDKEKLLAMGRQNLFVEKEVQNSSKLIEQETDFDEESIDFEHLYDDEPPRDSTVQSKNNDEIDPEILSELLDEFDLEIDEVLNDKSGQLLSLLIKMLTLKQRVKEEAHFDETNEPDFQTEAELEEWLTRLGFDETYKSADLYTTKPYDAGLEAPFFETDFLDEQQVSETEDECEVLREFLAIFDLQMDDLVNDKDGVLLSYVQGMMSLLNKQKNAKDASAPSWIIDLEKVDRQQMPENVISSDELELLNSLTDEEREILFPPGNVSDSHIDKLFAKKPDLEINLKRVGQENIKHLLQFFDSQEKKGIRVWKKGEVYSFDDGTEFVFKNDVFQRARKEGHEGVRYEAISNKAVLGEGAYGKVKRIKGTITLDSEQEAIQFKKQGKDGKRRVVKIQEHDDLGDNSLRSFRQGLAFAKRAEHLSLKEPTVEDKSLFSQTSYTVMDEITGPELFDVISDDLDGINILTTDQRIDLTLALLLALNEQVTNKGLIHRDIKPENIKVVQLGPPAVVKILDYDLSIDNPDGSVVGTPGYFSPETISDPMSINAKSDVYSMGRTIARIWCPNDETYTGDYTPWSYSPEQLLTNIFAGIEDLSDDEKVIIKTTLLGMLKNDPDERSSIENAIDDFMAIYSHELVDEIVEEPATLKSSLVDEENPTVATIHSDIKDDKLGKNEASELFVEALGTISIKIANLMDKAHKDQRYEPAAEKAVELLITLTEAGHDFFDKEGNAEQFKQRCDEAIKKARPELAKHRGWSKLFTDITFLTVSVCTAGVANIVSKLATGSFRFFTPPKTESEEQLDLLEKNIHSIGKK